LLETDEHDGDPFGWTMEGWGGMRPFNAGQDVPQGGYGPGWDIAIELVVR